MVGAVGIEPNDPTRVKGVELRSLINCLRLLSSWFPPFFPQQITC
jgi:hypothetical protein